MKNVSGPIDLDELIAGARAPRLHIWLYAWIRREKLQGLADFHLFNLLGGLDNRQWALQSLAIQYARS